MIGTGFQALIDNLFWYLPFSNTKRAADFLAKWKMSDKIQIIKRAEIAAKHKLERAPTDLKEGWTFWLMDNWPGQAKGAVALFATGLARWSARDEGAKLLHGRCPPRPATCEL